MTIKLFTHDRTVHADDVFASAILSICYGEVEVVRTRDPIILQDAMGVKGNYFLDIGGIYDPERCLFDHHQPQGAGFRNEAQRTWPYATAGLVWRHYGETAVQRLHPTLDPGAVSEIVKYIDHTVLKYIDAVDCGMQLKSSGPSLSAVIGSFNTAWFEVEVDNFPLVLELARVLLANFVKRHAGKIMARDKVRQAANTLNGHVLVLEGCHPWGTVVAEEMPSVLLVVYPVDNGNQWQIRCASNTDTSSRMLLPATWGGLERDALASKSGEIKATFCHRSRHLAGAFSKEAALNLAQLAIAQHQCVADVLAA